MCIQLFEGWWRFVPQVSSGVGVIKLLLIIIIKLIVVLVMKQRHNTLLHKLNTITSGINVFWDH